jgi:hypothetical protein
MLTQEELTAAINTIVQKLTTFGGPNNIDINSVVEDLYTFNYTKDDTANLWGNAAVAYNSTLVGVTDIMDFADVRKAVKRALDQIPPSEEAWTNIVTTAAVGLVSKIVNQYPAFWQLNKSQEVDFHLNFRKKREQIVQEVALAIDKLYS